MAKQPEVEAPEEGLLEEAAGKGKGRGARARVTLEGNVPEETLRRVIPGEDSHADAQPSRKKTTFAQAIKNTAWRIIAKRTAPTTDDRGNALGDDYEITPHDDQTEGEIKAELQQNRGGVKWVVRVIDEDGFVVVTKQFIVGGEPMRDPALESMDAQSEQLQRRVGSFQPPQEDNEPESPEDVEARVMGEIEADPEVVQQKKQARLDELAIAKMRRDVERVKAEAEMKRLRDESKPPEKLGNDEIRRAIDEATRPLKEANERLQKELDEKRKADEHKRDLDSQLAPMKATMETMAQKLSTPPQQGPTVQELLAKMDTMAANMKSDVSQQIAQAIGNLTTKFEAQISNINTQLTAFMSRPQDGGALATAAVGALTQIAIKKDDGGGSRHSDPIETTRNVLGLVKDAQEITGGGKGEMTIPPDFPSFLVDRVTNLAPQVIEYLERKQGGPVSREEIQGMFKEAAIKMYQELDGTIKREVRGGLNQIASNRRPGLPQVQPAPAPVQPGPFSPPPPGAPGARLQPGIPQAISPNAPPPSPESPPPPSVPVVQFGGGQPVPSPIVAPAPLAPMSADASLEKETRDRVNWVLTGLLREMKLGVQEMQWPEKAYGNLPKDVLDRIVAASTDRDVYDAISPWVDQPTMDIIFSYVSDSNPQHDFYREWLTAGVNWIKAEATGENNEPDDEPEGPEVK